jgi:hypothetical protein
MLFKGNMSPDVPIQLVGKGLCLNNVAARDRHLQIVQATAKDGVVFAKCFEKALLDIGHDHLALSGHGRASNDAIIDLDQSMCRLYGFIASEPTKVECTLVHSQNALMSQSRSDLAGYSHSHGWGVATFGGDGPDVERQAWAAYHGEHFERAAARAYATLVLAHVRRATVGGTDLHNTHPFVDGRWTFTHNGTVPGFEQIREKLAARLSAKHRDAIKGVTDSEHVFRLVRLQGF